MNTCIPTYIMHCIYTYKQNTHTHTIKINLSKGINIKCNHSLTVTDYNGNKIALSTMKATQFPPPQLIRVTQLLYQVTALGSLHFYRLRDKN